MSEKLHHDHLDWDNLTQPVPLNLIDSDFTYAAPEADPQIVSLPGTRSEILPQETVETLLAPPETATSQTNKVTESLSDAANFQRLQAEANEENETQQQRLEQWMANARARLQRADQEPTAPGRPLRVRRDPSATMIQRVEMQKTMFEPNALQGHAQGKVGEAPVEGFQDSSGYRTGKIDLDTQGDPMATLVVPRNTFVEPPPAEKTDKFKAIERKVAQIRMTESGAETFFMARTPPKPKGNPVRLVIWVLAGLVPIVIGLGLFALLQSGYLDGLKDLLPGRSLQPIVQDIPPKQIIPTPAKTPIATIPKVPVEPPVAPVNAPPSVARVKAPQVKVKAPALPAKIKIVIPPKVLLEPTPPSMVDMAAKAIEKTRRNIEASMLGVEVAKPAFGNQSAISTRGAAALRSAIQEAIQAYSQSIREVFERFSMGSPDLQGDIIIGITVHPNGHILEGSLSGSSTGSAAFDQEIVDCKNRTLSLSLSRTDLGFLIDGMPAHYCGFAVHRSVVGLYSSLIETGLLPS